MGRRRTNGLVPDELTREEVITPALLRVAGEVIELKPCLEQSDFDRLPSLRALVTTVDSLIKELGYADD